MLHSDFIVANQELNAGLVEVSVGLIPGWGGIKEMICWASGNKGKLVKNIQNIVTYNKSSSADYFISDYDITHAQVNMNKQLIVFETYNLDIPKKAQKLSDKITLLKIILSEELDTSEYNDLQIWLLSKFQDIISMRETTEQELLDLECKIFLEIARDPERKIIF